jgi:hypothetical protein
MAAIGAVALDVVGQAMHAQDLPECNQQVK